MRDPVALVEIWRGDRVESLHLGHAVVWGSDGLIESWGDARAVIYPRSAAKIIQALPLIESGAADAAGLGTEQLALACASHNGDAIHTGKVEAWLAAIGRGEDDLRCGADVPMGAETAQAMRCAHIEPRQVHNTCSGKHAGFLTLAKHLGAGPDFTDHDYIDIDHPVQIAVRAAWEEVTGEPVQGWAVDGCSAPNFATTLAGLARAMAFVASARPDDLRPGARAAARLRMAMAKHPELVAGEGRACTRLMRAMTGGIVVKTGAEAVYVAMVPDAKVGIALKIADGATRASEAAITALLVRHGALDRDHPEVHRLAEAPIVNCRGITTGGIRPVAGLIG